MEIIYSYHAQERCVQRGISLPKSGEKLRKPNRKNLKLIKKLCKSYCGKKFTYLSRGRDIFVFKDVVREGDRKRVLITAFQMW